MSHIHWSEFKPENLITEAPKKDTYEYKDPGNNELRKGVRFNIGVRYKYPNGACSELVVDYPMLKVPWGLKIKDMKSTKGDYQEYAMACKIDQGNQEHLQFLERFHEPLIQRMKETLFENYEVIYGKKKDTPQIREATVES